MSDKFLHKTNIDAVTIIRWAGVAVLYALLLTPMLLSSKFFFPYISTKTFYFRFLVEIALALYIIVAVADARFRPKINPLSIAVYVFGAVMLITSLAGVNFYRSFWGNAERGEGLATFLHVLALFVVLAGLLRTRRAWEWFFSGIAVVSLSTAVYATMQKMGVSWVLSGDASRISALIGNAAFYAGYLITTIFISLWLALRKNIPLWQKIFFWSVIVYELVILNYTRTRGALVGLGLGFIVMMVLLMITSRRKKVRYAAVGGLVIFVLFAGLIYIFRDSSFILNAGGLNNITHIERNDITTESRLLTWEASWKGFTDRWWSGYGYENFNVAFNKYFPAKIFRDSGSQIWFDRAHNMFFEMLVAGGVFGILSYLSLFVISVWALWKYYRHDPENNRLTSVLFTGFLISYFVQNLFVFDTLGTYISFYSVLAFFIFLLSEIKTSRISQPKAKSPNLILAVALAIVLGYVSYALVFKPAVANIGITKALIAAASGKAQETLDAYKDVIAKNTYMSEEARQKLGEAAITFRGDPNTSTDVKNRLFRAAIDEVKVSISRAPSEARNFLFLMAIYNNMISSEAGPREEVLRLGKKALELSPTRPQIYFEMGQAAHTLGRFDEGIGYFKKAVDLNPEPAESHWNLALAYVIAGRYEEGRREVDHIYEVKRIGKINDANLRNLIQIYSKADKSQEAIQLYETLIERHPDDAQVYAELGIVYGKTCQIQKATDQLRRAVELNPKFDSEVSAFLLQVQDACSALSE